MQKYKLTVDRREHTVGDVKLEAHSTISVTIEGVDGKSALQAVLDAIRFGWVSVSSIPATESADGAHGLTPDASASNGAPSPQVEPVTADAGELPSESPAADEESASDGDDSDEAPDDDEPPAGT